MLARCELGAFRAAGGRRCFGWKMAHSATSRLMRHGPTCTAASDTECWKVLLGFSSAGHELKVGHMILAHSCGKKMRPGVVLFQILDGIMAEVKCWYLYCVCGEYLNAQFNTDTSSKKIK